jgi:hypothetical protein
MAIQQITLFSPEIIKKFTPLNGSVDTNFITAAQYLAEDNYISEFIGTALMRKLKEDVNSWSGKYLTIMEDYLPKCAAWWTLYEVYPMIYAKHDNGGIVVRTTENATSITTDDLSMLREQAKVNAKMYTQRLLDYLVKNVADFPEYSTYAFPDRGSKRSAMNGMGILFTGSHSATSNYNRVNQEYSNYLTRWGLPYPNYNP